MIRSSFVLLMIRGHWRYENLKFWCWRNLTLHWEMFGSFDTLTLTCLAFRSCWIQYEVTISEKLVAGSFQKNWVHLGHGQAYYRLLPLGRPTTTAAITKLTMIDWMAWGRFENPQPTFPQTSLIARTTATFSLCYFSQCCRGKIHLNLQLLFGACSEPPY